MNKNENGFSLVVVVIFMSIAALFIGYLTGSWLISFLVEDESTEMAEQEQNISQVNQQIIESGQEETEEINNTENNLTAPPEDGVTAPVEENDNAAENTADVEQNQSQDTADVEQDQSQDTADSDNNSSESSENTGGFGVQIGAFSNYNNALSVRDNVSELGFEVVITDSSPHQVQVIGYESRDDAESAAEELETEGYPGFIVIRE